MKKYMCLIMACFIALAIFPAIAEKVSEKIDVNGAFKVSTVVPDGYSYEARWVHESLYMANLLPRDTKAAKLVFTIAYNEPYQGKTINEFTDKEIQDMISVFESSYKDPEHSLKETSMGTKLIVLKDKAAEDHHMEIITIYTGYEISVYIEPGEEQTEITDKQLQVAIDFLSNMQISK